MEIVERTVDVDDLQLGMFVCRLDRPWDGTPFPLQGFCIETAKQIDTLTELCKQVTIDVVLTREAQRERAARSQEPVSRSMMSRQYRAVADRRSYGDSISLQQEMPRARAAQEKLTVATSRIIDGMRGGKVLVAEEVDEAVAPVVDSVLRSADAVFWLNGLRARGDYEYSHALNCTVLAAAFGRHMGLPEEQLVKVASGGLLLDIGKTQLPLDLLTQKVKLRPPQIALLRRHVEFSLEMLAKSNNRSTEIEEMVGSHHERVDGSGYPYGFQGAEIPLFGRIAAIIDTYDAMTSDRPYRKALSRHAALQQLYSNRDSLFQSELIERFIQCIGAYPTGSLVELSTGEVAIVQAQNRTRQLLPKLLVLTSADKKLEAGFRELDLLVEANSGNQGVRIIKTLEPGSFGLDPTELFL
ncbi:MAG: HD-GYP domain-containing protein [Pseudomarimonas sp.]